MKKCSICCRVLCSRENPEDGAHPSDAETAECWREAYLRSEARREDASRSYDRTLSALYAAAGIRRNGIDPLLTWIAARREEHERFKDMDLDVKRVELGNRVTGTMQAALDQARHEGAEEMRAAAVKACDAIAEEAERRACTPGQIMRGEGAALLCATEIEQLKLPRKS